MTKLRAGNCSGLHDHLSEAKQWFARDDAWLPVSRTGIVLWAVVSIFALVAATTAPVATFIVQMMCFGLPHVLYELRYVDRRFSARLGRNRIFLIVASIACIALARAANALNLVAPENVLILEVGLGASVALFVCTLARRKRPLIYVAVLTLASLALHSPWNALVLMSVLDNWTPLAFLAESLDGWLRTRVICATAIPFLFLPLIIATGFPGQALSEVTAISAFWIPFTDVNLEQQLGSYLPPDLIYSPYATQLFAAAVFAQSMHYWTTIAVLPRLGKEIAAGRSVVQWPDGIRFAIFTWAASCALALLFIADYTRARSLYGLSAAVHSWLEVPVLLLALGGGIKAWSKVTRL